MAVCLFVKPSNFSLVLQSNTSEKLFVSFKTSVTVQNIKVCQVWPRGLSSWKIPLLRYAEGC